MLYRLLSCRDIRRQTRENCISFSIYSFGLVVLFGKMCDLIYVFNLISRFPFCFFYATGLSRVRELK